MGNGVKIRTINLECKLNPAFNIDSLKKITFGNKVEDNKIIQKLCDGILMFEDLLV
jgi:hypothetical protein